MPYPGFDGFLGTRASLMLDLVVVAMGIVLPLLGLSVSAVKYARRYRWHKWLQLALGIVLLVTVLVFEADMRINGWRTRATASPYFGSDGCLPWVDFALSIHLFFSITTAVLWLLVTIAALRKFAVPPMPGSHSAWHIRFGKLAAIDMLLTAVSGWTFYWLAFVAH